MMGLVDRQRVFNSVYFYSVAMRANDARNGWIRGGSTRARTRRDHDDDDAQSFLSIHALTSTAVNAVHTDALAMSIGE